MESRPKEPCGERGLHCRVVNPIGSTDIDCIDKINKPSPCLNKRSVFSWNIFSLKINIMKAALR